MKIQLNPAGHKSLQEFAKVNDLVLEVNEREPEFLAGRKLPRYYVEFQRCEIKDDYILTSATGNGDTIEEALADYAKQISRKQLVFNAYDQDTRRVIYAPSLYFE